MGGTPAIESSLSVRLAGLLARDFLDGGLLSPNDTVLDLGAGDGAWAEALTAAGCRVLALDRWRSPASTTRVRRLRGRAENLPLHANFCSAVTAVDCWHWFPAAPVLTEVSRILQPEGRILIAYLDGLTAGADALLQRWNPDWDPTLAPQVHSQALMDLRSAGLTAPALDRRNHRIPCAAAAWRDRLLQSAAAAEMSPGAAGHFRDALNRLLRPIGEQPVTLNVRITILHARRPGAV